MPVLVIAVVFFAIFLVMGVMGVTAMVAEHRGKLFSWKYVYTASSARARQSSQKPLSLMSIHSTAWEGAMAQR